MMGSAVYLLAAVGGYWVLERANSHKGRMKQLGQLLGTVIMVLSFLGVACQAWCMSGGKGMCGMRGKGMGGFCPYTSAPQTPVAK